METGGRPRKRRTGYFRWTAEHKRDFLESLAATGHVTQAVASLGADRTGAYRLKARDAAFSAAWDLAIEIAGDAMEAAARDRVLNGVPRPLHYRGKIFATVNEFSDRLLMFMLSRRRPAARDILSEEREEKAPEREVCARMRADALTMLTARRD
jgi:hypothetical protein